MRRSCRPVRKCHSCPLNLGERCWLYDYPRGQWRDARTCPAFDDPAALARFREWQSAPVVKTRTELRRELARARRREEWRYVPRRRRRR